MLGNNYQGKLAIYFKTADDSSHRVHTTVWANSNEHLMLKSETSLPLRAVVGFDFYKGKRVPLFFYYITFPL